MKQDTCKIIGDDKSWWARKSEGGMICKTALIFALCVTVTRSFDFSSGTGNSYFCMNLMLVINFKENIWTQQNKSGSQIISNLSIN